MVRADHLLSALATLACILLSAPRVVADTAAPAAAVSASVGDYRIVQWMTAEGLPQSSVNDIIILANGEMWLATFGGLVQFDGHTFKVLDIADEGMPANRIVALAAVGAESLLFLTQQGHLGRVDRGRPVPLLPPPAPSVDTIDLLVEPTGKIYCRSTDGRVWQTDGTQAWRLVDGAASSHGPLHDFAIDASGEAWGVSGDGLVTIQGESSQPAVPVDAGGWALSPRAGGGLWVGTGRGLGRFVDGHLDTLAIHPPLEARVVAVQQSGDDALWVATQSEVSRLDRHADGTWRRSRVPLDLPRPFRVASLLHDRAGTLWVGSAGSGLYRVNRLPIRRFGAESGFAAVLGLAPDGSGGAFVASGCGDLFHLDRTGASRRVPYQDLMGGQPLGGCQISLAPGAAGRVLARAGASLLVLTNRPVETRRVASGLPAEEGPIAVNGDGSVWVISRGGHVHLVSPDGLVTRKLALSGPLVSASLAPDGALWIGGEGEVFRVLGETVEHFAEREHVPRGEVRDIVVDEEGTVWVATYGGGVGRMRGGQVARLTVQEGLPDNSVSRMIVDGRDRMWISDQPRARAIGERSRMRPCRGACIRRSSPWSSATERGVPEANFGSPAGFAEDGGRLWFGTIDGVVVRRQRPRSRSTPGRRRSASTKSAPTIGRLPLGPGGRVPPLTARLRIGFTACTNCSTPSTSASASGSRAPTRLGRRRSESHRGLVAARSGPLPFPRRGRNEDGIWSSAPAIVVSTCCPPGGRRRRSAGRRLVGALLALAVVCRVRSAASSGDTPSRSAVLEEQRQAEERMASLRAQLEHVARAALAGELATSLAHEVRQPIGAIVNNAEAVRRNLPQYLQRPAELEQVFGDIVADGVRASEVVQGLRGFLGAGGPEAAAVDLSALVREMLPLVRRELQNNRVAVELVLAEGLAARRRPARPARPDRREPRGERLRGARRDRGRPAGRRSRRRSGTVAWSSW